MHLFLKIIVRTSCTYTRSISVPLSLMIPQFQLYTGKAQADAIHLSQEARLSQNSAEELSQSHFLFLGDQVPFFSCFATRDAQYRNSSQKRARNRDLTRVWACPQLAAFYSSWILHPCAPHTLVPGIYLALHLKSPWVSCKHLQEMHVFRNDCSNVSKFFCNQTAKILYFLKALIKSSERIIPQFNQNCACAAWLPKKSTSLLPLLALLPCRIYCVGILFSWYIWTYIMVSLLIGCILAHNGMFVYQELEIHDDLTFLLSKYIERMKLWHSAICVVYRAI